jgi:Cytidylate kinase-like family
VGGGWLERVLTCFAVGDAGVPTPLPGEVVSSDDFRRATEEVLRQQAKTGEGVILGRGAVVLLRANPRALRVRRCITWCSTRPRSKSTPASR